MKSRTLAIAGMAGSLLVYNVSASQCVPPPRSPLPAAISVVHDPDALFNLQDDNLVLLGTGEPAGQPGWPGTCVDCRPPDPWEGTAWEGYCAEKAARMTARWERRQWIASGKQKFTIAMMSSAERIRAVFGSFHLARCSNAPTDCKTVHWREPIGIFEKGKVHAPNRDRSQGYDAAIPDPPAAREQAPRVPTLPRNVIPKSKDKAAPRPPKNVLPEKTDSPTSMRPGHDAQAAVAPKPPAEPSRQRTIKPPVLRIQLEVP